MLSNNFVSEVKTFQLKNNSLIEFRVELDQTNVESYDSLLLGTSLGPSYVKDTYGFARYNENRYK